jgi:transcriptional regulator with XRE-family HTH domain
MVPTESATSRKKRCISATLGAVMSNDFPYADIGVRVAQAIAESRWTQKDMAQELGMSVKTLYELQRGRYSPYKRLERIAELTGVSHEWLKTGQEQPTQPLSGDLVEEMHALTVELRRLLDRLDDTGSGS